MQPFDLWRPLMEQKPSVLVYVSSSPIPQEPLWQSEALATIVAVFIGAWISFVVTRKAANEESARRRAEAEAARDDRRKALYAALETEILPIFYEAMGLLETLRKYETLPPSWRYRIDFCRGVYAYHELVNANILTHCLRLAVDYDRVSRELQDIRSAGVRPGATTFTTLSVVFQRVFLSCHQILGLTGALPDNLLRPEEGTDYSTGGPLGLFVREKLVVALSLAEEPRKA